MTDIEIDAENAKQLKKAKELIDAKLEQIDPDSTEKDAEIERLTVERDDLAAKLEMIAEKQFSIAREKAGAPEEIDSPEKLEAWKLAKGESKHQNPATPTSGGHAGSGKAPLSGEPSGSLSHVKEYGSIAEMMEDVRQRAQSSNPEVRAEAEEIQKKLLEKMAKDKKSHNFEFEVDLMKLVEDKRKKKAESGSINWDSD